jgi:hypothetical protein
MYFPKSQIETNLYTYGEELEFSPGNPYIGFYWKTSTGKYYTGKNPNDGIIKELFPLQLQPTGNSLQNTSIIYAYNEDDGPPFPSNFNDENINIIDVKLYNQRFGVSSNEVKQLPIYSPTLPTEEDYKIGEFERYFCVKRNQNIYLEIKKDIYNKLLNRNPQITWQSYKPFKLSWSLTGVKEQVFLTNKNIVALTSQRNQLVGFNLYLKEDYLKYYNG